MAQSVGINNAAPDPSAALDVMSTNQGVLVPRMTVSQRNAIVSPALGLLIYNIDDDCFNYFDGLSWVSLCGNSSSAGIPVPHVYPSDSIWIKPPNLKYIIVEVVGGGGNGTGINGANGSGGGGGGGYSKKIIPEFLLLNSENVVVGLSGGISSFGLHLFATGGSNASGSVGGSAGFGLGGDLNTKGSDGCNGNPSGSSTGGNGGNSFFGGGGRAGSATSSFSGQPGNLYGGGGGGAHDDGSGSGSILGGSGSSGVVVVTEFFD